MIWMSYTAVSASARGLIFTQSLLFLMTVSSDESGPHEGVRREFAVAYSFLPSLTFKLKKIPMDNFEPLREIFLLEVQNYPLFTNPTYTLLFSHYQPQNKRWANISFWVTCCAQRKMTGHSEATKSTCVIIIFIILVGGMTEASEFSISFSARRGFKLDILDRNAQIMSHVYIKHGFT